MDKKVLIALVAVTLMVAGAGIYILADNGSDDPLADDNDEISVSVYYIADGEDLVKTDITGETTLRGIFNSAVNDIRFNSAGQILSVGETLPGDGQKWIMWKWSPTGLGKWELVPSVTDDVGLKNGISLALMLSDRVEEDGEWNYTSPDIVVLQDIWFFIMFITESTENENITSYLTKEKREAGFWVRGEGINAAYALKDVADRLDWDLNMEMGELSTGWLYSFFGLEDVQGLNGWTFWSQYHWNGDRWVFNDGTLGREDPTELPYFALIRQYSEGDGMDATWENTTTVTPNDIPPGLLD